MSVSSNCLGIARLLPSHSRHAAMSCTGRRLVATPVASQTARRCCVLCPTHLGAHEGLEAGRFFGPRVQKSRGGVLPLPRVRLKGDLAMGWGGGLSEGTGATRSGLRCKRSLGECLLPCEAGGLQGAAGRAGQGKQCCPGTLLHGTPCTALQSCSPTAGATRW